MHKVAIYSDLHLKNDPQDPLNRAFLQSLRHLRVAEKIDELWLLGDIFDLLIGPFQFWNQIHREIFDEIKSLAASGRRVIWLEGNHDFHISHLNAELGIWVLDGEQAIEVAGKSVFLAHGDLVNAEDLAYLKWRRFTRDPVFRKSLSLSPEILGKKLLLPLAEKISAKSRVHSSSPRSNRENLAKLYMTFAERKINEGFDAVFMGHSHLNQLQSSTVKKGAFYLNLGSWLGPDRSYALWDASDSALPQLHQA